MHGAQDCNSGLSKFRFRLALCVDTEEQVSRFSRVQVSFFSRAQDSPFVGYKSVRFLKGTA